VDAEQARGCLAAHRIGDDGPDVATLGDIAGVAETAHQLRQGARHPAGVPADLGRLVGEAVAGYGRQHQVERVGGAAAVRGRVRERLDGLEQLDDRARPAVGHIMRAVGDEFHGRPACRGDAAAQRGELLVRNLDPEGVDPYGVSQSVAEAWRLCGLPRARRRRVGQHARSADGEARRNPAAQQLPSREPGRLDQHLRNVWRLGGGSGALRTGRSSRRRAHGSPLS
jgi:hypothetical protein